MLGFFIGCEVNNEPSTPGDKLAYVGAWAKIIPELGKDVLTFTIDTYVHSFYYWDGSAWVLYLSVRGSLAISGDLMTLTAKEISDDGSTWSPNEPPAQTLIYSISNNQLTLKIGTDIVGVYTKQ